MDSRPSFSSGLTQLAPQIEKRVTLDSDSVNLGDTNKVPVEIPVEMAARTVCDVAVPLTVNITSRIQKLSSGGRFELKQNMVRLLHSNRQFTDLSHEDPRVHIQNFLEISDTYRPNGGGGNQNYGNTYNPNWRNHLNFSWGGNPQNQHQVQTQFRPQQSRQQYNNQRQNPYRPKRGSQYYNQHDNRNQQSSSAGNMSMEDMLKKLMNDQGKLAADVRQYQITTQNLKKQVGQLVSAQNSRSQDGLPGNTDPNLKQANDGIPKYAKFVKYIVANKSKLAEFKTVALTEECSSRILNEVKLPSKQKDPGSFIVKVTIGKYSNARGLCDLGASINLMPRSILKKLGLGELKATTILLQLADRSIARPDGIIEDVLVQVESLIFPVNFIVLDFEPDPDVPFILGHPFLAIGEALIHVDAGRLTMRAYEKVEVFDVYQALKLPAVYEELSDITVIDEEVSAQCILAKDPLERVVMGQDIKEEMEAKELASVLDMSNVSIWKKNVEPLNRELGPSPKPSLEEAPNLELKQLPAYLRYVFLAVNNTLHVILSSV
ncbi:uncharacterized protein LOC129884175 [Solanum dulcamara]|uniref:uncharacterized protein LOC129884175 n=1 Tax=Solanum dulcamara TaxID=45834 RepID=UPI00248583B5|nr:uncharacterized protein LOC129884175 [Solanum dulcamara]